MAGITSPFDGHTPRLVVRPAQEGDRCRCGNRIAPGTRCLEVVDVPRELADWIQGRSFCGPACVREYLLESLEPLESAVGGQDTIRALRAVVASLEGSLANSDLPAPSRRRT